MVISVAKPEIKVDQLIAESVSDSIKKVSVKVKTLPSEPKEIKSKTTLNLGNLLKPAVPKVSKEEKAIFYDAHILLLQSFVNSPQLAETLKNDILASTTGEKGDSVSVLLFVADLLEDKKY